MNRDTQIQGALDRLTSRKTQIESETKIAKKVPQKREKVDAEVSDKAILNVLARKIAEWNKLDEEGDYESIAQMEETSKPLFALIDRYNSARKTDIEDYKSQTDRMNTDRKKEELEFRKDVEQYKRDVFNPRNFDIRTVSVLTQQLQAETDRDRLALQKEYAGALPVLPNPKQVKSKESNSPVIGLTAKGENE